MEKHKIKTILTDRGITEVDLSKAMNISIEELRNRLDGPNDDFLKKIEKTLGIENLFYMPEYGDNNTVASNNNNNATIDKLLDIIERQNETIKDLSSKLAEIALNNSKK